MERSVVCAFTVIGSVCILTATDAMRRPESRPGVAGRGGRAAHSRRKREAEAPVSYSQQLSSVARAPRCWLERALLCVASPGTIRHRVKEEGRQGQRGQSELTSWDPFRSHRGKEKGQTGRELSGSDNTSATLHYNTAQGSNIR